MTPARHRLRLVLAVFLLWEAGSGTALAQWYRTYDDGIQALKSKEWGTAKDKIESAKAEAERQGRRTGRSVLRYGALREPFLPDFYLGQAFVGLAETETDPAAKERYYQSAIAAFELARSAQVRQTDPEFVQLDAAQQTALVAV